jgi:hypothetical protein
MRHLWRLGWSSLSSSSTERGSLGGAPSIPQVGGGKNRADVERTLYLTCSSIVKELAYHAL